MGDSTRPPRIRLTGHRAKARACADEIVSLYVSGRSSPEVCRLLGLDGEACRWLLRCRGVLRTGREAQRLRGLPLDETFFRSIDREEKAYWLGFLSADGGVSEGGVSLTLQAGDGDHVRRFVADLKSGAKVSEHQVMRGGKVYRYAGAMTSSRTVRDDLIRLGVTPRKSLTLTPWQGDAGLMRHYWRGLFDGDGGFGLRKSRWHSLQLAGTRPVIEAFIAHLRDALRLPLKTPKPHSSIWIVEYSRRLEVSAVCRHLYDSATVFLPRKKQTAELALAYVPVQHDWSAVTTERVLESYTRLRRWDHVAADLGMALSQLRVLRQRFGLPFGKPGRPRKCPPRN